MGCNCKWFEIIVAVVVFVLAVWPGIFGMASKWIVAIAAIILLLHALMCKNCGACGSDMGGKMGGKMGKPAMANKSMMASKPMKTAKKKKK